MNCVIYLVGFVCSVIIGRTAGSALAGQAVYVFFILVILVRIIRRIIRKRGQRESKGRSWRNNPAVDIVLFALLSYFFLSTTLATFLLTDKWKTADMAFLVFFLFIVLVVAAFVVWLGYRTVPADRVGIVSRVHGRTHPEFRSITPHRTRGVLARTLRPGRSDWLPPVLYKVKLVPRTRVAENKIGLVTAKEGKVRPQNRSLALPVACDNFQDGRAFLLNGGEQGRQVDTLPHGQTYDINTELFKVEQVDRVYVHEGTIGLVNARAGGVRPPGRHFGPHVECENFQDGSRFLAGGGEQGRQLAILQGGAYYNINPALFHVVTVLNVGKSGGELTAQHLREFSIPIGMTGVVITLDGAEPGSHGQLGPRVPGHQGFRLPWVFLKNGGQRGVQEETLREGTVCALNPYFVRVVLVPTRDLILEWKYKTQAERSSNYDAQLGQITVTVQGHRLVVDLSQTLQIPPESAPLLVSRFGSSQMTGLGGLDENRLPVQRFVEKVLGNIVESYLNGIAAESSIKDFLEGYAGTQINLASLVRNALKPFGVTAVTTSLGEFKPEDPTLNEVLKRPAHEQIRSELLEAEQANVEREYAITEWRERGERLRVAREVKAEIDAWGRDNAMLLKMLKEVVKADVPQFIGGGDLSAYLQTQPIALLEDLLDKMRSVHRNAELDGGARPSLTKGDAQGDILDVQGDVQEIQDVQDVRDDEQ